MSWAAIFILLLLLILVFIFSGLSIACSLGIVGAIGLLITGHGNMVQVIGNITWNTANDFALTSIPLFLLMGEIILISNVSTNFYNGIAKFLRKVPGGLLHSNILACAIFSAISGSSVATAAAIGSVAIPDEKKRNYKKEYIYGSLAAGGTLGILIPPSIALIIYGALTTTSVAKLFTAAMVPGLVLAAIYMIYIFFNSIINKKDFANVDYGQADDISYAVALKGILPLFLLIVIVLGGIYTAVMTPTEAAAAGVTASIVIAKVFGEIDFKKYKEALLKSIRNTSMLLFIMVGAQTLSYALAISGATRGMVTWVTGLGLATLTLLIMIYCLYLVLGCFVESNSMQYLTIPVLFPILKAYGVDPIWFGVVLVVLIELGQITPPVGINLFVIKGIDPESNLTEVIRGVIPYIFLMFLMVAILTAFPQLATFLM